MPVPLKVTVKDTAVLPAPPVPGSEVTRGAGITTWCG
jgi:hypothetical protein